VPGRWLLPLGLAAIAVWAFAVIGAISVAQTVGVGQPDPTPPARLLQPSGDIPGADVAGLPRYAGSTRSEYRQEADGASVYTEVEYVTDAGVERVRNHFVDAFERTWTVLDVSLSRREWVYVIRNGQREANVEIDRVEGVTEIEIEVTEPRPRESAPSP
jgi:hypothetical protein